MLEFDENDELFIGDKILMDFANCLDCGLCCKVFDGVEITEPEIELITDHLGINRDEFVRRYIQENHKHNAQTKKSLRIPCSFQK